MANFVKFERGLKSVFNTKKDNNRLDSNTLYFVYETANATQGELYLGTKLIGGTSSGATYLSLLSDVDFTGVNLIDGMILHYDSLNSEWVPYSIVSAIEDAKNAGANVGGADVTVGTKNENETISAALARLVSNPTEGDIAIISGSPWVYSGTNWISLDDPSLDSRISTLETDVANIQNNLEAVDGKIATAIATANHLRYRVLSSDEVLNASLEPDEDIRASTVFLVPKNNSGSYDSYDEYMWIKTKGFEKLGSWTADLSNYVTTTNFNSTVGSLDTRITNLEATTGNYITTTKYASEVGSLSDFNDLTTYYTNNNINATTLVDGVLDIYDRLTWNELSNS